MGLHYAVKKSLWLSRLSVECSKGLKVSKVSSLGGIVSEGAVGSGRDLDSGVLGLVEVRD